MPIQEWPSKPKVEQEADDSDFESHAKLEKIISAIEKGSAKKHIETSLDGKEIIYKKEKEKYSIERITSPDSPYFEQTIEMTREFDPKEIEPMDSILEGITLDEHRYMIAIDEKGEVAAYVQGSFMDIMPESGNIEESEETAIFFGYCMTKEKFRQKRLTSELVKKIFISFLEKAKKQEQEISAIIVEAYDKAQPLFNSLGLRRVYFRNKEGKIEELPYRFPPMQWDRQSGKPLDPVTGKIGEDDPKSYGHPEHLMVRMLDGRKKIETSELLAIVESIYEENHILYERGEEIIPEEAKTANRAVVDSFKNDFKEALNRSIDGKLILMSEEEYKKTLEK